MTVEKKIENAVAGATTGPSAAAGGKLGAFLHDLEPFFYRRPLVYVDVGAHRGDIFAEICASSLKIQEAHLIEPNPMTFSALERRVVALEADRFAICHHLALSDRPGRLRLRDADTMTKVIGPAGEDADPDAKAFEVEARTLDALAQGFTVPHVSLLKIDVEGHEAEVLAGAQRLLEAAAIDLIYIEAGLDPEGVQQTYYRAIEDLLRPYRYRLFRIYEQTHEWLNDSPLLRRANFAFMSAAFAERNPFLLSRDLMTLRKEKLALETALTARRAEIAVLTAETTRLDVSLTARFAEIAELTRILESERGAADDLERRRQATQAELDKTQVAQHKLTAALGESRTAQRKLEAERDKAQAEATAQRKETTQAQSELALLRSYGRELEDRIRGLLESRSWRILEPARRLSRRLKGRKAPQPFAPRLAPGGALTAAAARARPGSFPSPISSRSSGAGFRRPPRPTCPGLRTTPPPAPTASWRPGTSRAGARRRGTGRAACPACSGSRASTSRSSAPGGPGSC